MVPLDNSGIWQLFIPDLGEGETYKFEIQPQHGPSFLKADPFGLRAELARDDDRLSEYVAGLAPPVMAADHEPTECPVCTKAFEPRMDLGVLVCAQHGAWFEQGALEKLTGADRTSLLELLMGEGSATAQVKPTPEVDSFFAGLRKAGEWADFAETALSAVGLVVALVVFFRKH